MRAGIGREIEAPEAYRQAVIEDLYGHDRNAPDPVGKVPKHPGKFWIVGASIEVSFPAKPPRAVLDALKDAGFNWSRYEKIWYARNTEHREVLVRHITEG